MLSSPLSDLLAPYLVPPSQPKHRLFHGRGKTVPSLEWLTVDRFPPVLVATLFRPQEQAVLAELEACLTEALAGLGCQTLVFQHRYDAKAENQVICGELPDRPVATEQGLDYKLDFQRGQNLGFFADMAEGRSWLRERAEGCKVLNLFSFTCSFSVAALAGGARSVVNIDLSDAALTLGKQNHALNGYQDARIHYLPHNIFRSWKKLHSLGRYDIIVVDPPSAQKGSFMAEKDYPKMLRKLHKLLAPEADLLICLNAPWLDYAWLEQCVADNLSGAQLQSRLPGASGFDEAGEPALKTLHYRYQRPAILDVSADGGQST
ncbi:class I SAM-dependent methyltransferase [uncultured Alcanivorax sp.]|jgi:23S rRNA (cytosine1962-C5)-methyltransferase|uniref:class I SAM-dependent methyltransferase n=1 Tax=uncultured Alcanivorax sp. TaxID=191215 RepID=UPI0025EF68A2|nr:class I SAM-dependent methyltransferase [uncultured Alcanivorax sp.]